MSLADELLADLESDDDDVPEEPVAEQLIPSSISSKITEKGYSCFVYFNFQNLNIFTFL